MINIVYVNVLLAQGKGFINTKIYSPIYKYRLVQSKFNLKCNKPMLKMAFSIANKLIENILFQTPKFKPQRKHVQSQRMESMTDIQNHYLFLKLPTIRNDSKKFRKFNEKSFCRKIYFIIMSVLSLTSNKKKLVNKQSTQKACLLWSRVRQWQSNKSFK